MFPRLLKLPIQLCILATLTLGCGTRVIRTPVFKKGVIESYLRTTQSGGQTLERGFEQPVVIAPVRLTHVLSFIDVELPKGKKTERRSAIPPELLYGVGDALGAALEQAGPDDEVVVRLLRQDRRLGIFSQDFLTAFVAYVKDGSLTLFFSHSDWELPKFGADRRDNELPEPKEGLEQQRFRVLPSDAFITLGPQTLAVDWRQQRFAEPERIEVSPLGEVRRREILLEEVVEPAEEGAAPEPVAPPESLSPAALRDLADLEEARRAGKVTEGEYQQRRAQILRGGGD
jgi:hypothetical protein